MATKQLVIEAGVVASVNEKGIRLRGHDAWLNYSKFPDKQVPHPMQGETVTVTYDAARWIEALTIGEPTPAAASTTYPPDALDLLAEDLENSPTETAHFRPDISLPYERAVYLETRREALHAAAVFLAPQERATTADVLRTADTFAAWLLRFEAQ